MVDPLLDEFSELFIVLWNYLVGIQVEGASAQGRAILLGLEESLRPCNHSIIHQSKNTNALIRNRHSF
jgi:hypothetical protein